MIWLMWRQHRLEMLLLALVLILMAVYLIHSGLIISAAYYRVVVPGISVATCQLQQNKDALCQSLVSDFHSTYEDPNFDGLLPLILPALMGVLLGVPLVARELEQETFRLTWTQSVTQRRWLLVNVVMQASIALIVFAIVDLLVTWYIAQNGSFGGSAWDNFDIVGIAPLAYMVFALALGIAAGALLPKTIPAMIVTLIGYVVARIAIWIWVRPYYLPPLSVTWDPDAIIPRVLPGNQDWVVFIRQSCQFPPGFIRQIQKPVTICTDYSSGWLRTVMWQPVDRFWLFQGIEGAIFFGLAAALLTLTFWWVRTRIG